MRKIYMGLLLWLKKKLDRIYYSEYTFSRETLIRKMFPWVIDIWEYKKINEYIASHSFDEITKVIEIMYAFYWGEVNMLVHSWKEDEIKYLKWILDFSLTLQRFKEQYLIEQESSKNKF